MKTLKDLCQPRPNIFERSKRDIVLDLTDLAIKDRINPTDFFEENYLTEGMKRLFKETFRRLKGDSQQGVFKLTQAMGGGKTHNLIALGLLARHPEMRPKVLEGIADYKGIDNIRVVAFSGRETDYPFGVWGAIAEQLGKKEVFKDYYSPLQAPGQTAWVNLLKGEPLLILLDELPPYFEAIQSKTVGNSDLSVVTTAALSNLFVAVGKDELTNVCIIISDLKATYQSGSQQIVKALSNLEGEVGRNALSLEPVGLNTDELYHILRKRLFVKLPKEDEIKVIAQAYAQAVKDAKQMDITAASPDTFASQIIQSYPFHPAIRDLYARFRENSGFQQTRGLIRLMRVMLSRLYADDGKAKVNYLVHAHDIDLNDRDTLAEISQINPSLDNAISHDIASAGKAIAENIDTNMGKGSDAQDVSKLLLISSLANVPNAVVGLSSSDVVSYLCAPGRDVSRIPKEIVEILSTKAWYLHSNREGKYFFKNVQNLVAKIRSIAESYNRESSLKELRAQLQDIFTPSVKDCYQQVQALPPIDEIEVSPDKVTLVIYEPYSGTQVHPDIERFYNDLTYKNRVLFLTGSRGNLEILIDRSKDLKAVKTVIAEIEAEKVRDDDPLKLQAQIQSDKIGVQFLSALRETFTAMFYPSADKLQSADLPMNFSDNKFEGEKQVKKALEDKQKFTNDITSDTFRKKIEARLFTTKKMQWGEVTKRAATTPGWQWHLPTALDLIKRNLIDKGQWRDDGSGYIEKPPFPKPQTNVFVQQVSRNEDTGEAILKITPVHGDVVHYEYEQDATTASRKVEDYKTFKTKELIVSFLCVDSKGEHEAGAPYKWPNRITIKHRLYQQGSDRMVQLQVAPSGVPIRYTTDGSEPGNGGAIYTDSFVLPRATRVVSAVAEKNGVVSERISIPIDWEKIDDVKVDPAKSVVWRRSHDLQSTQKTYEFLSRAQRFNAELPGVKITIKSPDSGHGSRWLELLADDSVHLDSKKIEKVITVLRELLTDAEVHIAVEATHFAKGQALLDWVTDEKTTLKPGEVIQK